MSNEKVSRAPWQVTGSGLAVQAKFGQYLQKIPGQYFTQKKL
jgi:hypothetical protein